ncbi:hypothetical protein [Urbifossiella limnaea]|uniref:DUF3352 domain-containing protein n=1 Tax=Urbifossiella limnaea TaxID=2528023 RepID=A0A517XVK5_9BACT|nr:hypothetical protein [Urbifossiella limnaea]QDU21542.1 hypothetical protein ETAA1_35090 [Urbifossiella limnaea]
MYRLVWSVLAVAAAAPPLRAAGPAVADLFPADTLAYVEVRDAGKLAPQVTAALAGSPLADVAKFVDARRDAGKTAHDILGKPQLAVLGLLASPELASEVGRLGGVAAGVTGFTDTGDPEAVVAVLTGDSAAAGLAARGFLALAHVRRVAAVDGVPVYQFRVPQPSFDPNTGQQKLDNTKPPAEGTHEATAAYTPGLFVYGTSKAAVAAVLTRYRGKGAGLGGVAAFKASRDASAGPGLFVYADAAALLAKLDAARRAAEDGPEPDALGWVRMLGGDRAVTHVAGTVRFRDGGLAADLTAAFAPGTTSPLLTVLSGPGAKAEFLGHAGGAGAFAATVSFPEKGRAAAVLGFLDAAAKATGTLGRTPAEAVKEIEARTKTPVTDGLVGRTRAVTVFAPKQQQLAKGVPALPTVVLHAETAEVAAAWEEFLPKLHADVTGAEAVQPASESVDGVKVLSLPGAGLPWNSAVHYARKDAAVAVGLDRAAVAAAVTAGPPPVALPADNPAALAGFLRLGGAARALLVAGAPAAGPVVRVPTPPRPVGPRFSPDGNEFPPPEAQSKAEEKAIDGVWAALDALPPLAVTARRDGDRLRVELAQPVGKAGFAPAVAAGVAWFDVFLNRAANPNAGAYPTYRRVR